MRLAEAMTIYLAAAAPVGVAHFLKYEKASARAWAAATGAALVWPAALALILIPRRGFRGERTEIGEGAASLHGQRRERAKRALLAALNQAEDAAKAVCSTDSAEARQVMFKAREAVECFVGLTVAAREASVDALPSPREMELCRVAGRSGDDLNRAGRCIHRRHVTRLLARRERARIELLHALAEVGETPTTSGPAAPFGVEEVRHFSAAVLEVYARAVNLLSLLDDDHARAAAARLLDAQRARQRSESPGLYEKASDIPKGAPCATPLPADSPAAPVSREPRLMQS